MDLKHAKCDRGRAPQQTEPRPDGTKPLLHCSPPIVSGRLPTPSCPMHPVPCRRPRHSPPSASACMAGEIDCRENRRPITPSLLKVIQQHYRQFLHNALEMSFVCGFTAFHVRRENDIPLPFVLPCSQIYHLKIHSYMARARIY